jgi:hypothetical protein
MGVFLRNRWCFYSIYGVLLLKFVGVFYNILLSQMLKKKYIQKYFGIFKNGQKKCPKIKRGEIVWENQCL